MHVKGTTDVLLIAYLFAHLIQLFIYLFVFVSSLTYCSFVLPEPPYLS